MIDRPYPDPPAVTAWLNTPSGPPARLPHIAEEPNDGEPEYDTWGVLSEGRARDSVWPPEVA